MALVRILKRPVHSGFRELDHRVQAESGQRDRPGHDPGGDRDRGLGDHPGDAEVLQREPAAAQPAQVAGGHAHRGCP